MDSREQRAAEIADRFRIIESNGQFFVPSQQSADKKYAVRIGKNSSFCDCPDFELRQEACKHVMAVRLTIQHELNFDGTETVTETVELTRKTVRKTYPQEWTPYNEAQVNEKDEFQKLLFELCRDIKTPPQVGRGQRRLPLSDMIFSSVFKVYSTFSGRRFMSDLREAKERGFIAKIPHFNSIFNCFDNPDVCGILTNMIELTALPLKAVEEDFAVDSSGFGVSRFFRWYDHKYGVEKDRRDWVKIHVMVGTKTNIVTAVEIRGRDAADAPLLRPLLHTTRRNFEIAEVSADKGYLSFDNAKAIAAAGATPYIAFKSNSTIGDVHKIGHAKTQAWTEMYCHFACNREDFMNAIIFARTWNRASP